VFDNIEQSIPEAENQIAKFTQRFNFLTARMAEIVYVRDLLSDTAARIEAFLDGPAAALIQERIRYTGRELPYHVIYGWQGDPPPGDPTRRGLWHMVKVEARIPGRCDNACDPSQSQDVLWIHTKRYGRWLGIQKCFELQDTDGVVKMRVTRFDENRPSNPLLFPNSVFLWDFRAHPDRSSLNDASSLEIQCPPYQSPSGEIYTGAFLANGPDEEGGAWNSALPSDQPSLTCWTRANRLLTDFGVKSETCAKYYYHEGDRPGFDFRFVPCADF
jgi:hypothetical protein